MNNFFKRFLALILVLILAFSTSLGSLSGLAAETKIVYDGLYGNQLTGLEREIYDVLVESYVTSENYGETLYELKEPIFFNAEIDENNKLVHNDEYLAAQQKLIVAFNPAVGAFIYDYPQIFWFNSVSMTYSISATYSQGKYKANIEKIKLNPVEIYSNAYSKVDKFDSAVDKAVNEIKKAINGKTDRYSVVLEIHDYVCEKAYYKLTSDYDAHSAEPIFVGDGGVVCEGYAKAFKILCEEFNIPCALVSGKADTNVSKNEPHMWNYVKMTDDKWYLVDATWDDGTPIGNMYYLLGKNSQGYYKKVSDERREDNHITSAGYKEFVLPELSENAYKSEIHNWSTKYTIDVKATCSNEGSKSRHCLTSGCTARTDIQIIEKEAHRVYVKLKPATLTANGSSSGECSVCGKDMPTTTIYRPTSFKLSTTSYTYDGKVKSPSVTVKDSTGKTMKKDTDYTVSYSSGRKNAGTYKVTIKMKGNYSGSKVLTFKINAASSSKCSFKLSTTSYTYDGKVKSPTVIVKGANGATLKKNTDYTVTYASGRKNVGAYKVTIRMKGNYSGSKTLTFKVNPPNTTISKLAAGKKSINAYVTKKSTQVTGYQIYYSTSKTFKSYKTKNITSYKSTSASLSGLSAKKTYYIKVRTYKTVNGTKYYSGWSTVKSVKTK